MKINYFVRITLIQVSMLTSVYAASSLILPEAPTSRNDPVNLVFAIDDSGSMDFETMLDNGTTDGVLWWNTTTKNYWSGSGTAVSWNAAGKKTHYLFPNGYNSANSGNGDQKFISFTGGNDGFTISPLSAYAFVRSPDFNPSYYNPKATYEKWAPAYLNGTTITFPDSPPAAARSHPYFTAGTINNTGTPTTFNLTATYYGQYTTEPIVNSATGACGVLADSGTSTGGNAAKTLKDTNKNWVVNSLIGKVIVITGGTGSGQTRTITANTANTISVGTNWTTTPKTDAYRIISSFDQEWTFRSLIGMAIPATISPSGSSTTKNLCYSTDSGATWKAVSSAGSSEISAGIAKVDMDVMIPYNPATVWLKDNSCTDAFPSCAAAPNGTKLRRYDINSSASITYKFSDGTSKTRNKVDELKNFANWFTYYRKRRLLAAGSYGLALERAKNMGNVRAANVFIHNSSSIPDLKYLNSVTPSENNQALTGEAYAMTVSGGTPSTVAMYNIASQYGAKIKNIAASSEKLTCQRFNSFLLTDGFPTDYNSASVAVVPNTDFKKWFSDSPYGQPFVNSDAKGIDNGSFAKSFTNIASYYYSHDMTSDLGLSGTQPALIVDSNQNTNKKYDYNTKPHINTYAITIGAKGQIFAADTVKTNDPYSNYPSWTAPTGANSIAIDDLWHSTINGRGKMLLATDSDSLADGMTQILGNMAAMDSRTGLTVSSKTMSSTNHYAFLTTFAPGKWTGDVSARPVDLSTGAIGGSATSIWNTNTKLDNKFASTPYTGRIISTWGGNSKKGVPFTPDEAGVGSNNVIFATTGNATSNDANNVINYLRGDRTNEYSANNTAGIYRQRESLLGDIVNSQPAYVINAGLATYTDTDYSKFTSSTVTVGRKPVIYVGANDGMLHAFDVSTYDSSGKKITSGGSELWAYIPGLVQNKLNQLANRPYDHVFTVDGAVVANDVDFGNTLGATPTDSDWRTIIVGALRNGGHGIYALDVSNPELPSTSLSDAQTALNSKVLWELSDANFGYFYGKPVIAKTEKAGWVVLVTSGYNNTAGDGKGHLYILNAKTGSVIKDFNTNVGSTEAPSGLGNVGVLYEYDSSTNALIKNAYATDLDGVLWSFNLSGDVASWSFSKMLTLPKPITTAPTAAYITLGGVKKKMVYVGTGKILEQGDLSLTTAQDYIVGIEDNGGTTVDATSGVAAELVSIATSSTTGNATDSATQTSDTWHADNIKLLSATTATKYDWWKITGKRGFILPMAPGDQVIADMVYYNGLLVFSATAGLDATTVCADAMSYLYVLDAKTGTEVPSTYFSAIDGTKQSWSRVTSGTGFSGSPTIYKTNGKDRVAVCPGGNCVVKDLPVLQGTIKRYGWREIYR